MKNYPHPIIAKEGWPYLTISFLVALLATYFIGWWSLPFWAVVVFILQFFRDPPRDVPQDRGIITSPADGRVVVVEASRDPYLNRDAFKISVFMNVFNAHSNRSPVTGTVQKIWYHPGSFVNASLAKASLENERNAVWIKTGAGADITVVQVAGLIARRILCYVDEGERLTAGQRYGFIRFGSRLDVYLPTTSQARVTLGEKVYAGSTILAQLND